MRWLQHFLQIPLSGHSLSALFYLRCLLLLLALFVGYLCVREHAKLRGYIGSWTKKEKTVRAVHSMAKLTGMLILGMVIGYGARDVTLMRSTRIWTEVRVIDRSGPEYLLGMGHSEYHITFCPDDVPNWYAGYVIDRIVSERRGDCYSLQPRGMQYKIARR